MTRDHATIAELLAVQALGGLDGHDVELLTTERATHGDCDECRRLEAEFAETAGRLAFSLDPEPVDAAIADRILAAEPAATGTVEPIRSKRAPGRGWIAAVAVAASLAVVVVAATMLRPGTTEITAASPSQQIVRFDAGGEASLVMAYTPGRPGAVFWGSDMPDPGEEQVYEIWMIQDGEPIGGGCVRPTDGTIALSVDADIGTSEQMAVTVEDAACPGTPSGDPVMVADLPSIV